MLKITEFSQRSIQLKAKAQEVLSQTGMEFNIRDDSTSSIRLVFAGQYSAGKSSILKMLTGRIRVLEELILLLEQELLLSKHILIIGMELKLLILLVYIQNFVQTTMRFLMKLSHRQTC